MDMLVFMQKYDFVILIDKVMKNNEKCAFKSERTTCIYNIYISNVALTMSKKYTVD